MDYRKLLAYHKYTGASLTIGAIKIPTNEAYRFGILGTDDHNRVTSFIEKPSDPDEIDQTDKPLLASMGVYIFNSEALINILLEDAALIGSDHDFGKDIIPKIVSTEKVFAYPFVDELTLLPKYWQDVGTIDSYWKASMDLIGISPQLNLYDIEWPIRTAPNNYPPAKFIFNDENRKGTALDSLIAEGCIISGAHVEHSLLSTNVTIEQNSVVRNSIVLPNVNIGSRCRIKHAIIDKGCIIPDDTIIGEDPEQDMIRFDVSDDGITLVEPEMLGQKVFHIE